MSRPVLHNQLLPNWLHRFANGLVGGLVALAATVFLSGPMWLAVPVGLGCMFPNPRRFSLVESWAGGDGYGELDGE
jgi:hypothetical protein